MEKITNIEDIDEEERYKKLLINIVQGKRRSREDVSGFIEHDYIRITALGVIAKVAMPLYCCADYPQERFRFRGREPDKVLWATPVPQTKGYWVVVWEEEEVGE